MPRYIALLRAINVGGHVVTMDRLRALFGELGLTDVESFIASGNVIFSARPGATESLERRIAAHLEQSLGYQVGTFLRSADELAAVAAHEAFPADEVAAAFAVMIAFLPAAPGAAVRRAVESLSNDTDAFRLHGRELYWLRRDASSDPKVAVALGKALSMPITVRNLNTVRRLAEKYG